MSQNVASGRFDDVTAFERPDYVRHALCSPGSFLVKVTRKSDAGEIKRQRRMAASPPLQRQTASPD
jgi:hypothetical protein